MEFIAVQKGRTPEQDWGTFAGPGKMEGPKTKRTWPKSEGIRSGGR